MEDYETYNIKRKVRIMISNPKHGWCNFKLGDFVGTPSYLTDVPVDLLNAFISYYEREYGVAVFDEEGSTFTLILSRYTRGIFVIEEKDKSILHDLSDMNIDDLAKELIQNIESDMYSWEYFIPDDDPEEIKIHRDEILQKIAILKKYVI